jgi:putative ABC transport system permease protein
MVRGRLTKINGVKATSIVSETVDEVYRELNLTWSDTLPEDNTITSGDWWQSGSDTKGVSIESELADKLGVKVGDTLRFVIGDQTLDVPLKSIRKLRWDRMRPNFYFIFSPGILEEFPATYITSFYLPSDQKKFVSDLMRAFPTVTVFEIDEMIYQVRKIISQVSMAIELVLGLILVSGALVLVAALLGSIDQRLYESAILRALGGTRQLIMGGLAVEFLFLGLSAGVLAAAGSELTAWGLQTWVFQMGWSWHWQVWVAGPLLGVMLIPLLGLLATRRVVRVAPMVVLRELV